MEQTNKVTAPTSIGALSISQFCATYHISRSKLYEMWQAGEGPPFLEIGSRRLIRIVAAETWAAGLERTPVAVEG